MSSSRTTERSGWRAILVASLVGVVASLAIVGLGQLWIVTLDPGGGAGWAVLLLMPTLGGLVAGVLTPRGSSASVGSGLLVGLTLGLIAVLVGIAQFYDVVGGDQAGTWVLWGVVGTPFLMLLAGFGGVLGDGLTAIRARNRDRSTTDVTAGDQPATRADEAAEHGRRSADAVEGAVDSAEASDGAVETSDGVVDDSNDGATASWSSSFAGMGRATLEGTGATFVLGVVGLFAGPLVAGVPFFGGFVAGYRSPGGRGAGTFCGLATGVLVAVVTLTLVVLELESQSYVAPGAGIALAFLALVLFVGIPFAAVGGFVGAMAAASGESEADDPEGPARSAES